MGQKFLSADLQFQINCLGHIRSARTEVSASLREATHGLKVALVVFPLGFSTIRTTSLRAATERCVLRTAKGNKARPERRFGRSWIRNLRLMEQLGRR